MEPGKQLSLTDWLAIERTKLANERTFLAYFRTAIVLFSSGFGIYKIEIFAEIQHLGISLMAIAPFILVIGIIRLFKIKKILKKYYNHEK